MKRLILLFAAVAFFSPSVAWAMSSYLSNIPNSGDNRCANCHINPRGGGARNDFGLAYVANGRTWNAALATLDSDGDGYTNGEELGDPDGDFADLLDYVATLPADSSSFPCGNGITDGPEACDGPDLTGESCETLGFDGGELACEDSCLAYDDAACVAEFCGDGIVTGDEECDGDEFMGASCSDYGLIDGELACDESCFVDLSDCEEPSGGDLPPDAGFDGGDDASSDASFDADVSADADSDTGADAGSSDSGSDSGGGDSGGGDTSSGEDSSESSDSATSPDSEGSDDAQAGPDGTTPDSTPAEDAGAGADAATGGGGGSGGCAAAGGTAPGAFVLLSLLGLVRRRRS